MWLLQSIKNIFRDEDSRITERNRMTEIVSSAQITTEIVLRLLRTHIFTDSERIRIGRSAKPLL
jgi:hypothetical protein